MPAPRTTLRITESIKPIGVCTRTATDTAITIAIPNTANAIMISAEAQKIRFTIDGSTPTATLGLGLVIDEPLTINMIPGSSLKVIGQAAAGFVNYQLLSIAK